MNNLPQRLKLLRCSYGLSQADFGKPVNIPGHQISKYERDEIRPASIVLAKLYHKYKVNLNWLVTGEGNMLFDNTVLPDVSSSLDSLFLFANFIRSVRKQSGMSMNDFAERLGITYITLKNFENAISFPQSHNLSRMAEMLNSDIETLNRLITTSKATYMLRKID